MEVNHKDLTMSDFETLGRTIIETIERDSLEWEKEHGEKVVWPTDPLWRCLLFAYIELQKMGDGSPMSMTLAEVHEDPETGEITRTPPSWEEMRKLMPDVVAYAEAANHVLEAANRVGKIREKEGTMQKKGTQEHGR